MSCALLAGGDVAHPEIPVADERAARAVGRHRRAACRPTTARPPPRPPRPPPPRPPPRHPRPPAPAAASTRRAVRAVAGVHDVRVFFAGSTTMFSVDPSASVVRYQKRPSGSQFGVDAAADDQTGERRARATSRRARSRRPSARVAAAVRGWAPRRWRWRRESEKCNDSTCRVDPSDPVRLSY